MFLGSKDQPTLHGILLNVPKVNLVVSLVANAVVAETPLPNGKPMTDFFSDPMGRAAFDELHGTLKGCAIRRSQ